MKPTDIALSERVTRGARYLTRILNADGGIPAVKPGDPSGCWTTAEGTHAVMSSPWLNEELRDHLRRMTAFLISSQLSKVSRGAWPLVVGGRQGSTMATAQAVLALELAEPLLDPHTTQAAEQARTSALNWLRESQGQDGGWGVEPNGGTSGKTSRVVSTFLALRALAMHGDSVRTSQCLRRGVDWLWTLYDGSGFPPAAGQPVAVCSTVRALWSIQACGAVGDRPHVIQRAIDFIRSSRPPNELWPVDTEVYVPDLAPGQIVFNNNTSAELLDFLVQVNEDGAIQLELVEWFQQHQRDDGSWCLGANNRLQPDVVTWPTNEAVLSLSNFLRSARFQPIGVELTGADEAARAGGQRIRSALLWMFASLSVIEAVFLFGAPSYLMKSWTTLPPEYRRTFWWAAIMAVALNIASTIIVYFSRRLFRGRVDRAARAQDEA